jgi:hypothetical protein
LCAKAVAHVRRDRKRLKSCTAKEYKNAIHAAVAAGGDLDYYTGEELDWSLVSTFDNAAATEGMTKYKKAFCFATDASPRGRRTRPAQVRDLLLEGERHE